MKIKSINPWQSEIDNLLNNRDASTVYSQQAKVVKSGLLIKDKK